eukprot:6200192-Alexandrium_andersonii.AAC.1
MVNLHVSDGSLIASVRLRLLALGPWQQPAQWQWLRSHTRITLGARPTQAREKWNMVQVAGGTDETALALIPDSWRCLALAGRDMVREKAVSYTHLTLPTICSV